MKTRGQITYLLLRIFDLKFGNFKLDSLRKMSDSKTLRQTIQEFLI